MAFVIVKLQIFKILRTKPATMLGPFSEGLYFFSKLKKGNIFKQKLKLLGYPNISKSRPHFLFLSHEK